MKTTELVRRMIYEESQEVKRSTGGLKPFREIMTFILNVRHTPEQIEAAEYPANLHFSLDEFAEMVEDKFTKEEIDAAKNVYVNEDAGR